MSDAVANLLVKILYESDSPSAAIESMKELKRQAESVTRAVRATNQAQSSPGGVQRIKERIAALKEESNALAMRSRGAGDLEDKLHRTKIRHIRELDALERAFMSGKVANIGVEMAKMRSRHREEISWIKKKDSDEAAAHRTRLQRIEQARQAALKAEREARQAALRSAREGARMERQIVSAMPFTSRGMGAAMFMGGFSRLGGFMPSSPIGFMARQSVTGGLLGTGAGQMFGSMLPSLGGGIGRMIGGARYGGPLGAAIGAVGSMGSTLYGGFRGVTMGLTTGAMTEGSKLIFRAASTFASSVASFARTTYEWTKRLGIAGLGAATALTAAGVSRAGAREQAIAGLGVVAGRNAPGLMNFVSSRRSSMFSRTEMINAATQGAIFGLSPDLIRTFLPMMQNAAALTGNPVDQGLRALSRAAFQAEPEAAEAYGLNLYERNLRQSFPNANFLDPNEKARITFMVAAQQLSRFRGAEQMISGTIPGATRSMRTGLDDFLSTLGASFAQSSNFMGRATSFREYLQGPRGQGLAQRVGGLFGGVFNAGANFLQNTALPGIRQFFSADREGTAMDVLGGGARNLLGRVEGFARGAGRFIREKGPQLPGAISKAYQEGDYSGLEGLLPGMAGQIAKGVIQFIRSIKSAIEGLFSSDNAPKIGNWLKSQWAEFKTHLENEDFSGMARSFANSLLQAWMAIETQIAESFGRIIRTALKNISPQNMLNTMMGADEEGLTTGERFLRSTPGYLYRGVRGVFQGIGKAIDIATMGAGSAMTGGANLLPKFHDGTTRVPGPYGAEVPAVLEAGEMVVSKEKASAGRLWLQRLAAGAYDPRFTASNTPRPYSMPLGRRSRWEGHGGATDIDPLEKFRNGGASARNAASSFGGVWRGSVADSLFGFASDALGTGGMNLPAIQRQAAESQTAPINSENLGERLGWLQAHLARATQGMNFHGNVMINGDGNKLARMADGI